MISTKEKAWSIIMRYLITETDLSPIECEKTAVGICDQLLEEGIVETGEQMSMEEVIARIKEVDGA